MSDTPLRLLGTDGKMYEQAADGSLAVIEHSDDFHGFGIGAEALGISEEEAKAQADQDDVTGHHGWHCHLAYGPYYDIFLGCYMTGWHRH